MPADVNRIDPFEDGHARPIDKCGNAITRPVQPIPETDDEALSFCFEPDSGGDLQCVIEHVFDSRRIHADDRWGGVKLGSDALNCLQIDRTDRAEVLSEDDIGSKVGEKSGVEPIERFTAAHRLPNVVVNLG